MLSRAAVLALLAAVFMASSPAAQDAPPKKLAASLARLFGANLAVDTLRLDSSAVLRVRRTDSVLGFAEVRNVIGRDQPITFLVAVDPEARLRDVDILVYREPYGGEVAYESWRRQFRGKSAADPLEVGRDIRGISGATISVRAVTEGIRRSVAGFARWRKQGRLH